eukprot:TRINITY_DN7818_c0_g1_i6.p1 TRINITY_DN7818_c0_g1~~TRINITY_DN7818_c0_g1_i6.p1  ORF type:complete len:369 (+),score=56.92 TRINITY_DN7818_c0_g1_i6:31-1107(+)
MGEEIMSSPATKNCELQSFKTVTASRSNATRHCFLSLSRDLKTSDEEKFSTSAPASIPLNRVVTTLLAPSFVEVKPFIDHIKEVISVALADLKTSFEDKMVILKKLKVVVRHANYLISVTQKLASLYIDSENKLLFLSRIIAEVLSQLVIHSKSIKIDAVNSGAKKELLDGINELQGTIEYLIREMKSAIELLDGSQIHELNTMVQKWRISSETEEHPTKDPSRSIDTKRDSLWTPCFLEKSTSARNLDQSKSKKSYLFRNTSSLSLSLSDVIYEEDDVVLGIKKDEVFIKGGTLQRLIERITCESITFDPDNDLLDIFLLTYHLLALVLKIGTLSKSLVSCVSMSHLCIGLFTQKNT